MTADEVRREECQRSMERLHERVDQISKDVTEIKISAQFMKDASDKIHEAVFGNGKPGVLQKITQVFTNVYFQWWLIGGMVCGMTTMIIIFVNYVVKN